MNNHKKTLNTICKSFQRNTALDSIVVTIDNTITKLKEGLYNLDDIEDCGKYNVEPMKTFHEVHGFLGGLLLLKYCLPWLHFKLWTVLVCFWLYVTVDPSNPRNTINNIPIIPLYCFMDVGLLGAGIVLETVMKLIVYPKNSIAWKPASFVTVIAYILRLVQLGGGLMVLLLPYLAGSDILKGILDPVAGPISYWILYLLIRVVFVLIGELLPFTPYLGFHGNPCVCSKFDTKFFLR